MENFSCNLEITEDKKARKWMFTDFIYYFFLQ